MKNKGTRLNTLIVMLVFARKRTNLPKDNINSETKDTDTSYGPSLPGIQVFIITMGNPCLPDRQAFNIFR